MITCPVFFSAWFIILMPAEIKRISATFLIFIFFLILKLFRCAFVFVSDIGPGLSFWPRLGFFSDSLGFNWVSHCCFYDFGIFSICTFPQNVFSVLLCARSSRIRVEWSYKSSSRFANRFTHTYNKGTKHGPTAHKSKLDLVRYIAYDMGGRVGMHSIYYLEYTLTPTPHHINNNPSRPSLPTPRGPTPSFLIPV